MKLPIINTSNIDTTQNVEISVFGMIEKEDGHSILASSEMPEPEPEYFDVIVQPRGEDEDGVRDPILEYENLTGEQAEGVANILRERFPKSEDNYA